jgi:hypothetical protein
MRAGDESEEARQGRQRLRPPREQACRYVPGTLLIIGGRGKVIFGDVGSVPTLEFVLAQKIGLIDEAAASA